MRSVRIVALLLLAIPLVFARPERLAGQELRGVAHLGDGRTPAAGGIIEAVLETDSLFRARALVGAGGNFLLRLPSAGRYRITGLRIGFLPTSLGVHQLGTRETRNVTFRLGGVIASLEAIRVEADSRCERVEGGGRAVATLLAQARLALQATLLSSPDGRASATWRLERLIADRHGVALSDLSRSTTTSATDRPFTGVPIERLAREGYAQVRGTAITYRAPDAEALLSEQFVSSHCFRVATSAARPTEVGVSFSPAEDTRRTSDFVDVAGTLWLDRASSELRRLEFAYVGLDRELEEAGGKGLVEFKRLESGVWFVNRWWIRMPRASIEQRERETYLVVRAMELTGGEVESVRLGESGATLYQSSRPGETTLLPVQADPSAAPSCAAGTEDLRDTPGLVFGMAFDVNERPLTTGTVVASWVMPPNSVKNTPSVKYDRTFTVRDGFFMFCGLPLGRLLRFQAVSGTQVSPTHSLRLRRESTYEAIRLGIEDDK